MEHEPTDKLMYENLLKQVFQVWINPEIERLKKEGEIGSGFKLTRAQIIFSLGGPPEIRLNDKVKVKVKAKINRSIKEGEMLYERDIDEIQGIQLIDEEKDFGHISTVFFRGYWMISFSFIYDVSKSKELIKLGDCYLNSAKKDYSEKNFRPMIESLSIATENYAKARMYLLPDKEIRKSKKHGFTQTKVNLYTKNNIFKREFKDTFNKLLSIRDNARYNPEYDHKNIDFGKMLSSIEEMRSEVVSWVERV